MHAVCPAHLIPHSISHKDDNDTVIVYHTSPPPPPKSSVVYLGSSAPWAFAQLLLLTESEFKYHIYSQNILLSGSVI
jgi:hypothetical protein